MFVPSKYLKKIILCLKMAENNEIPENADKVLFAEDLISYVMFHNYRTEYLECTAEPFREYVHNAFNDITEAAVRLIHDSIESLCDDTFNFLLDTNSVNIFTYKRLAKYTAQKYFPYGFDANNFLPYCVHLASLAMDFYQNGVRETHSLAVFYIVNALKDFDMTTGGWNTLNGIAETYASMVQDYMSDSSLNISDDEMP